MNTEVPVVEQEGLVLQSFERKLGEWESDESRRAGVLIAHKMGSTREDLTTARRNIDTDKHEGVPGNGDWLKLNRQKVQQLGGLLGGLEVEDIRKRAALDGKEYAEAFQETNDTIRKLIDKEPKDTTGLVKNSSIKLAFNEVRKSVTEVWKV